MGAGRIAQAYERKEGAALKPLPLGYRCREPEAGSRGVLEYRRRWRFPGRRLLVQKNQGRHAVVKTVFHWIREAELLVPIQALLLWREAHRPGRNSQ